MSVNRKGLLPGLGGRSKDYRTFRWEAQGGQFNVLLSRCCVLYVCVSDSNDVGSWETPNSSLYHLPFLAMGTNKYVGGRNKKPPLKICCAQQSDGQSGIIAGRDSGF